MKNKNTLSEYEIQAEEFLKKCGATLRFRFIARVSNPDWGDNLTHNCYGVTITTPLGKMKGKFWDSYSNTQKGNRPRAYDFLACMDPFATIDSFEDFCREYGYDEDSRRAEKTYRSVKREVANLRRIFTEEQLEELSTIT